MSLYSDIHIIWIIKNDTSVKAEIYFLLRHTPDIHFYNSGLEPSTDSQSAQQHLQHSGEKRCVAITFHNRSEALKVQPCPSFTNINKPYGFAAHSWIYVFGVPARKCKSTSSDSEPKGRPSLFSLFSHVSFMPQSGEYAPPKQYLHGDTHTV